MTQSTRYLPVFLIALLAWSCNPSGSSKAMSEAADAESTEEMTATAPALEEPAAEPEKDYEIAVINDQLPSPRKEMTGDAQGVEVVVNYGSPSVKGRDIWGALVPFNKVWRTGANEATVFTIEQDVLIEGQILAAGSYGLFTIPGEDEWTLIFNSVSDQWGSYEYDDSKDVLRVQVDPQKAAVNSETLDFMVNDNQVILQWEFLAVPFTVNIQS